MPALEEDKSEDTVTVLTTAIMANLGFVVLPRPQSSTDTHSMLRDEKYTDIVIKVDRQKWKCHKAVVFSRCVFSNR